MVFKEIDFENDIEEHLLTSAGYTKADMTHYDKRKALNLHTLIEFIKDTQPKEWKRYQRNYKENAEKQLYRRFNEEIEHHGILHVLRHGINDRGVRIRIAYFKPESGLNPDVARLYELNRFEVARQFRYSSENNNSIDLVLLLNGIPIVGIELKNNYTRQSVDDAMRQWMYDRNPREKAFQFNSRFLVYFAVDTMDVFMTTHLNGKDTFFLPFNQGSNGAGNVGGQGNPVNPTGYPTAYLWEKTLQADMLMRLIQRYMHLDKKQEVIIKDGKETTKITGRLIFPRYQQLDVVTKLIGKVEEDGSGENYLVQHSAGSGKSNSIAWLAYGLSNLHNEHNQSVYSSVIVISDRRVLDNQLQKTIAGFDHTPGVVETIGNDKSSKDLRDAINNKKKIIVTTIQKFLYIYDELDTAADRNFAIIIDEAHQSQTGKTARKMQEGLSDNEEALKEYAELNELEEDEVLKSESALIKELATHGRHDNISRFAFTATPVRDTLEMFGEKQADGSFKAHHIYSMRQAIEEGFILDVLENYMTYQTSYKIASTTETSEELPSSQASRKIRQYASLHPTHLRQKTEVIVEQFREITSKKINGTGKAMVLTDSRQQAVLMQKELKKYIKEMKYDDLSVLVAFSGKILDKDEEVTESDLNLREDGTKISENQLPNEFATDDYNVLVVADKYQTGFDEPRLHTIFVNKKLRGIRAVQALSRANRTHPGKKDTFILDFVNTKEDIAEAFAPYYEATILDEGINPNLIYNARGYLRDYVLYDDIHIDKFTGLYYKAGRTQTDLRRMSSVLKPTVDRFNRLDEEEKEEFARKARNFVKWYSYITQITRMFDEELHKEYIFISYLERLLPKQKGEEVDLEGKLKLEYFKLTETFKGDIKKHENESSHLESPNTLKFSAIQEEKDVLDNIIERINERMKGIFDDGDRIITEALYNRTVSDREELAKFATNNDEETFTRDIFPKIFEDIAHESYMESVDSFEKLFADTDFYEAVMLAMAKEAYREFRREKES